MMLKHEILHPPLRPPPSCRGSPPELTLFDSTCIIVGIIIGAGIYRSSPDVAGLAPSATWLIGLWLLGGASAWPECCAMRNWPRRIRTRAATMSISPGRLGRSEDRIHLCLVPALDRSARLDRRDGLRLRRIRQPIWPRAEGGYGTCVLGMTYAVGDGQVVALTAYGCQRWHSDGDQRRRSTGREMDAERVDHRQGAGVDGDRGGRLSLRPGRSHTGAGHTASSGFPLADLGWR